MLVAVALAIGGTMLAPYVIERMTDDSFRQWTRFVIFTVSIIYLVRAAWLYSVYWHGWPAVLHGGSEPPALAAARALVVHRLWPINRWSRR